eukprot:CAMPEP_0174278278 /NCGR_PEP_ID=MMETSP0439-20130205/61390_1 /TAXON_ID=0 /ORGANISM="Stereomyxa ramosa, Strain Chinc5" /LENGTH=327 /DNA_ID=CAMNT_0015370675 /DNA_START=849 /DNA_END=1828 /DNA_ORIENTATION=+
MYEKDIFDDLCSKVVGKAEIIRQSSRLLADIDVGSSLAILARDRGYCRPTFSTEKVFSVKDGRHAVVEALQGGPLSFTSNSCDLDHSNTLWLITGPNMGGKSTFLRQNAVISIMAQMGSFVPAKEAHLGIVDAIFSRVGGTDDLVSDLSTFLMEMKEVSSILKRATGLSFIICDEIGRGTATHDGLAIAQASMEYIHNVSQSRCLFATHYHNLATQSQLLPRMSCYHLTSKEVGDEVVFLRKIKKGASSKSYGINVAAIAGLPEEVIERAKVILSSLEKEEKQIEASKEAGSLALSKNDEVVLEEIKKCAVETTTPIEALQLLNDWS